MAIPDPLSRDISCRFSDRKSLPSVTKQLNGLSCISDEELQRVDNVIKQAIIYRLADVIDHPINYGTWAQYFGSWWYKSKSALCVVQQSAKVQMQRISKLFTYLHPSKTDIDTWLKNVKETSDPKMRIVIFWQVGGWNLENTDRERLNLIISVLSTAILREVPPIAFASIFNLRRMIESRWTSLELDKILTDLFRKVLSASKDEDVRQEALEGLGSLGYGKTRERLKAKLRREPELQAIAEKLTPLAINLAQGLANTLASAIIESAKPAATAEEKPKQPDSSKKTSPQPAASAASRSSGGTCQIL